MFNWLFTKEHIAKREAAKNKPKDKYRVSMDYGKGFSTSTHTFMLNGKILEPGTPDHERAMKAFNAGMIQFDKGMKRFDESMKIFDKTMKDL